MAQCSAVPNLVRQIENSCSLRQDHSEGLDVYQMCCLYSLIGIWRREEDECSRFLRVSQLSKFGWIIVPLPKPYNWFCSLRQQDIGTLPSQCVGGFVDDCEMSSS